MEPTKSLNSLLGTFYWLRANLLSTVVLFSRRVNPNFPLYLFQSLSNPKDPYKLTLCPL